MEREIGEIFEYKGEWYQCISDTTDDDCNNCFFQEKCSNITGDCSSTSRSDGKSVAFKKLKKVGKPYEHYEKFYQCYKLPMETEIRLLPNNCYPIGKDNLVEIEIKQKEDMDEKKIKLSQDDIDWLKKQIRWAALPGYITHEEDYDRATEEIMNLFIPSDTEHSSSEKIGKNLKPFDLEAAKAGKPVCTRDGRKARLICFDKKGAYPIVALVNDYNEEEYIKNYDEFGKKFIGGETSDDLMMLPEKKEGWVNIYKSDNGTYYTGAIFYEKNDALVNTAEIEITTGIPRDCIDTVKISWEE